VYYHFNLTLKPQPIYYVDCGLYSETQTIRNLRKDEIVLNSYINMYTFIQNTSVSKIKMCSASTTLKYIHIETKLCCFLLDAAVFKEI
jgi:hypothetical protein